jgi:Polyketide cyclase / dehydrase and lipid transport
MPQVMESTVVSGPVGEVWALLRDFGAIGDWHPALPPAEIEDGPADRVGSVRVFPLAGGHRETLVALDDQQRRIAFTFADHAAGLPVRSYTSTITARPITVTDGTYIEWSSRFDCDEADEDKTVAQIRDGVLVPGLKVLGQRFGPGIRDAARSDAVSSGA